MAAFDPGSIRALTFDVFGSCVDWRGGIVRVGESLTKRLALPRTDWGALANAWRRTMPAQLDKVRSGKMSWTNFDVLHRMSLVDVLAEFKLTLPDDAIEELADVWGWLAPWPDVVGGLERLKKKYIVAALSNGNVAVLVGQAKRGGIPWDAIIGADMVRHYKPQPAVYLMAAGMLGAKPEHVLMVAAHNRDLAAARNCGLKTAFVARPTEFGPDQIDDLEPKGKMDVVAKDFGDLAAKMGC